MYYKLDSCWSLLVIQEQGDLSQNNVSAVCKLIIYFVFCIDGYATASGMNDTRVLYGKVFNVTFYCTYVTLFTQWQA